MYTNRTDYERALNLIKEKKIHVPRGSRMIESLSKQRYLPNGRMNLTLVDGGLRSAMHMFAGSALEDMGRPQNEEE